MDRVNWYLRAVGLGYLWVVGGIVEIYVSWCKQHHVKKTAWKILLLQKRQDYCMEWRIGSPKKLNLYFRKMRQGATWNLWVVGGGWTELPGTCGLWWVDTATSTCGLCVVCGVWWDSRDVLKLGRYHHLKKTIWVILGLQKHQDYCMEWGLWFPKKIEPLF